MEQTESPKGRYGRYQWQNFADGHWYQAQAGTDYEDQQRFMTAGRMWARRHGFRWSQAAGTSFCKFRIYHGEEA